MNITAIPWRIFLLQIYRSKKRPFSQGFSIKECDWAQQKIISYCDFPVQEFECMVCCPMLCDKLCVVHWLLSKYHKYYCGNKLWSILWNEVAKWVRHFQWFKSPTSLLSFFYDVLPNIWVTQFGGMRAGYMESVVHTGSHKRTVFHIMKTVVLYPCERIKSSKEWSLLQILWRWLGWSFWRGRIQGQQGCFPVSLIHYLNRLALCSHCELF